MGEAPQDTRDSALVLPLRGLPPLLLMIADLSDLNNAIVYKLVFDSIYMEPCRETPVPIYLDIHEQPVPRCSAPILFLGLQGVCRIATTRDMNVANDYDTIEIWKTKEDDRWTTKRKRAVNPALKCLANFDSDTTQH